jgi:hypothetical protein
MKILKHPIRHTIIYGLICGLSFIPLSLGMNVFAPWSRAIGLTFWLFLAGYALILNRWHKKFQITTLFPVLLMLPVIFLTDSMVLFFILALIVTGWIRSGICYQKPGVKGIAVELLLSISGGLLVLTFTPGSVHAWALGVWMFFLVQALYFVFFEPDVNRHVYAGMDSFEKASKQAETILSGTL